MGNPLRPKYLVFCFYSLEMGNPLRPKYHKKYKNTNIWPKKKNTHIRNILGKATLNTFAKFQGLSLNNGVDIGL